MILRERAWELVKEKIQSENLRKHCLSVECVMRSLAKYFKEDDNRWGIVGLLHDGDYEFTKEDHKNHAKLMVKWLIEIGEKDEELLKGVESHGWFHEGKKPETRMQWALFCSDELTGLIIAVALIRPDKKLANVTVENVLSKWKSKSFAAGVKREDIENCEKELGIPLPDFIEIALDSMKGISEQLGL